VLLAHHDTLLEALSSSAIAIVAGGALARAGRASLPLVLLAPLCGIVLADVFLWWAGRRWGDRVVRAYAARRPRAGRWIDAADRWVLRHGVGTLSLAYFLPVPNGLVYLSCGTAGMSLLTFAVGDAVGTLLWTALLVGIGWSSGQHGVHVVDGIQHYGGLLTIAGVICFILFRAVRRRRSRQDPESPRRTTSA
jgi:membrane protein DedA with SNARE-associated domain